MLNIKNEKIQKLLATKQDIENEVAQLKQMKKDQSNYLKELQDRKQLV